MIISYFFPKKIYIENKAVIEELKADFNLSDEQVLRLKVGDWFDTQKNYSVNTYVVKPLDTFESVAKKLGISKNELQEKVNSKRLFVGQKIII